MDDVIHIRHAVDDDLAFIRSSWAESHRDQPEMRLISQRRYMKKFMPHIRRHMKNADILVAGSLADKWQVFGYVVGTKNTVYWLYVKYPFRRLGIGTKLLMAMLPRWKIDHEQSYQAAMWSRFAPYLARGQTYQTIMYNPNLLEAVTQ